TSGRFCAPPLCPTCDRSTTTSTSDRAEEGALPRPPPARLLTALSGGGDLRRDLVEAQLRQLESGVRVAPVELQERRREERRADNLAGRRVAVVDVQELLADVRERALARGADEHHLVDRAERLARGRVEEARLGRRAPTRLPERAREHRVDGRAAVGRVRIRQLEERTPVGAVAV